MCSEAMVFGRPASALSLTVRHSFAIRESLTTNTRCAHNLNPNIGPYMSAMSPKTLCGSRLLPARRWKCPITGHANLGSGSFRRPFRRLAASLLRRKVAMFGEDPNAAFHGDFSKEEIVGQKTLLKPSKAEQPREQLGFLQLQVPQHYRSRNLPVLGSPPSKLSSDLPASAVKVSAIDAAVSAHE
nr:dynein assembly factor with WDR repeat domains 1 [Ipomoea trifida]